MELESSKGLYEVGGDHLRVVRFRGSGGSASPVKGHFMRRLGESLDDLLPSVGQTLSLLALALFVFLGAASLTGMEKPSEPSKVVETLGVDGKIYTYSKDVK